MSGVWCFVLVFLTVGQVFAVSRNCNDEALAVIKNCDECIRCGGFWCKEDVNIRCTRTPTDQWCTFRYEPSGQRPSSDTTDDDLFEPHHHQRFVRVSDPDQAEFTISTKRRPQIIDISFVNSSVEEMTSLSSHHFSVTHNVKMKKFQEYAIVLTGSPTFDFCPAQGDVLESLTLSVGVPTLESDARATITYQVPCACDYVDVNSPQCSRRGDYLRGVCTCHTGWKGERCDIKTIDAAPGRDGDSRGDIGACQSLFSDEPCSGNGVCNSHGTCDCDTSKEGYQYYDHTCADICMSAGSCQSCLLNNGLGQCNDCENIYLDPLFSTVINQTDSFGRRVWVMCHEKTDSCTVKYVAMKDDKGAIHVVILEPCNAVAAGILANGINVTVPAVLGLVALVAAVAAAAGYMVWRHRAPPQLPLAGPDYTSFDAEDCTGENPLYKPPTSSFKNPTYGKW